MTLQAPPRTLALVPQEVEELELVAPVDLLRRAGGQVTLVSMFSGIHCSGRNGIILHTDRELLPEDGPDCFDLLLIPGGPGVRHLRQDGRAARLASAFAEAGKPVGAICAAPLVLKDAGLTSGLRLTAHPSTRGELPQATGGQVEADRDILTASGAGAALSFGLALVERLHGPEKRAEVAASIACGA